MLISVCLRIESSAFCSGRRTVGWTGATSHPLRKMIVELSPGMCCGKRIRLNQTTYGPRTNDHLQFNTLRSPLAIALRRCVPSIDCSVNADFVFVAPVPSDRIYKRTFYWKLLVDCGDCFNSKLDAEHARPLLVCGCADGR